MRKRILNQPIDIISMDDAAHLTRMSLIHPRQFKIITLNPEMVVNAAKDFEFQAAINNAQLIVPDGTGIVWASKLLNPECTNGLKRIPGIELAENILQSANELGKSVAIYGGTKEVLEKATTNLQMKYPKVQLVKAVHGYQENEASVAREIAHENPSVVLVALGTPKQEIWINKYSSLFPRSIMIGIGGSLDVWSGKKQRAPGWVRDNHVEWLFRVISEPQRIPRVLRALPKFVWMVLKKKLEAKSSPQTKQVF